MTYYKILIVDDEPAQHLLLSKMLLEGHPNLRLMGVCGTVDQAVEFIKHSEPDLVFLDVMMPGKQGFELLKELPGAKFEVIFTTSYDSFAIQAFRLSAVDYLLKPFGPAELKAAIQKFEARVAQQDTRLHLEMLMNNISTNSGDAAKVVIPTTRGTSYCKLADIIRIESSNKFSTIILKNNEQIITTLGLSELEEMLEQKRFFRAHNSHIVNLSYVHSLLKKGDGRTIVMEDKTEIELARRRRDEFIAALGE